MPILARPETPAEVIAAVMRLGLHAGETLLAIRPAREADVEEWRTQFSVRWTGWGPKGRFFRSGAGVPAPLSVPYLALIERKEAVA